MMSGQTWFNTNFGCPICNRLHAIRQCTRFLVMDVEKKVRTVADHGLCTSCLAQSHLVRECRSIDRCKRCFQQHNTLLHPMPNDHLWFPMTAEARVYPRPNSERYKLVRMMIDPNAARSSISQTKAKELGCIVRQGRTVVTVAHRLYAHRNMKAECAVENVSERYTPQDEIDNSWIRHRALEVTHADIEWYSRDSYHMVLGADVIPKILIGATTGKPGRVYVQKTIFGDAYFGEGIVNANPDYIEYA